MGDILAIRVFNRDPNPIWITRIRDVLFISEMRKKSPPAETQVLLDLCVK